MLESGLMEHCARRTRQGLTEPKSASSIARKLAPTRIRPADAQLGGPFYLHDRPREHTLCTLYLSRSRVVHPKSEASRGVS